MANQNENNSVVEDQPVEVEAQAEAHDAVEDKANGENGNKKKESFYTQATSQALRPFVIISSSYLLFTITDGAIRMIVLLHACELVYARIASAVGSLLLLSFHWSLYISN
jgi:hypothetical protein